MIVNIMNITEVEALAASKNLHLDPPLLVDYPIGTLFWCIHHALVVEPLYCPLVDRLEFILEYKPVSEHAVRLQALRPVKHPELLPGELVEDAQAEIAARAAYVADPRAESARAESMRTLLVLEWDTHHYHSKLLKQWAKEYPDHPRFDLKRGGGLVFPEYAPAISWNRW